HALLPWALHVEAVAPSPGAGERAIDVDGYAEGGALGAELVGRPQVGDQRLDEGSLVGGGEFISRRAGRRPRRRGGGARRAAAPARSAAGRCRWSRRRRRRPPRS